MIDLHKRQDFWAGIMFLVFGLGGLWMGRSYSFGTPTRMGAGFLPMVLSVILVVFGSVLTVGSIRKEGMALAQVNLRPATFVILGIVAFMVLIQPVGLVGAICATTILCSFATPEARLLQTVVLAILLATFSTVLFVVLLGQSLPIWWSI